MPRFASLSIALILVLTVTSFVNADDALEQARFFHFPFIAHLDRVEALLLEVRLLRAGDDDQVAAARGDSAVEDLSRKRARGGNRKKK